MIVSLIIPTHNRRLGLDALLQDLRFQNLGKSDLEVIVVDSVEGDDISDLLAQHAFEGLNVRRLLTSNVIATKRNAGAREATGSLLIFLDDDLRVPNTLVTAHVEAHDRSRIVVSGQIKFPAQWIANTNYYKYKNSRHMSEDTGYTRRISIASNHVVTMNLSIPAPLFNEIRGFDESFVEYGGEDIEFGFRCARNGITNIYSPLPMAVHCEVAGDVGVFARKIYVATFYGATHLAKLVPEMFSVRTFQWTEPKAAETISARVIHSLLKAMVGFGLVHLLIRFLRRTDQTHWLYCPFFYKILTLLVTQLAVNDRAVGCDNRHSFE
ncbi:glycosyltransferase [Cryobacterium glaciale]|uniref:Glycosyltransferase n=1 Tax=Cryobacterium glaciale TaxID=1259145 RepID=A0A4R8UVV7_9MICO|nr:glycosyltransferase [Cryobacterium glaciale]TFB71896.1 glycosyltransferase [Cryobacterium glaciale]